ncbi:hypothetical protein IKE67_00955 [bacterium]|nr:hypothetical protein [bacterium]
MGVLTSSLRMFTLQSQRSDLTYKIDLISQAKANLTAQNAQLINAGTDLSADSPVLKQLEARKERLHLLEKKLDQQLLQYQTQLSMIDAQMKHCSSDFDSSVKSM